MADGKPVLDYIFTGSDLRQGHLMPLRNVFPGGHTGKNTAFGNRVQCHRNGIGRMDLYHTVSLQAASVSGQNALFPDGTKIPDGCLFKSRNGGQILSPHLLVGHNGVD